MTSSRCACDDDGSRSTQARIAIAEGQDVVSELRKYLDWAEGSGAWAEAIDRLLDDGARRAELTARGLERVSARYAWPVVARAHLEFFEALLGDRRD